jgi:hypothetical protein
LASGVLNGKVAAFGPLRSLQVTTDWELKNFGAGAPANAIDLKAHYADGRAEAELTAAFGVSNPVKARITLPLRLEKNRFATGTVLDRSAPFSFALDCSALFVETLPNDWRFGFRTGVVSGGIASSNTLEAPQINGEALLVEARLEPPPPWPEATGLGAQVRFASRAAMIDSLHGELNGTPVALRGRLTINGDDFRLEFTPEDPGLELLDLPASGASLSTLRLLGVGSSEEGLRLQQAVIRGSFGSPIASLTIQARPFSGPEGLALENTFFLGRDLPPGQPVLLRALPPGPPATILRPSHSR